MAYGALPKFNDTIDLLLISFGGKMSDTQLREAFTLMKQGQKSEALRLVQEVLREDRRNANAWWLMSHLLDDEDKVVKALENLLSVNPEHAGARQKLGSLRPEYAHLAQQEQVKNKNNQKSDAYWKKIDKPTKQKELRLNILSDSEIGFALPIMFVVVFFCVIGFVSYISFLGGTEALDFPEEGELENEIVSDTPNTPEGVARAFLEAYYRESEESLYALSCPAYHPEVALMAEDFHNGFAWRATIDLSQTVFEVDKDYSSETYAFVNLHGVMTVMDGGVRLRTDWDEVARSNGYENWGYSLENIDGQWLICQS